MLKTYFTYLARKLEKSSYDPYPYQRKALQSLVKNVGSGGIGVRLGLAHIKTTEEMKSLPISEYKTLELDFQKACNTGVQASSLFGQSKLIGLGHSSGTTATPKTIPLNKAFLSSYQRFMRGMIASYFKNSSNADSIIKGKCISLPAQAHLGNSPGGLPYGYMSGFAAVKAPFYMRKRVIPSEAIINIPNWEHKVDLILEEAIHHDVRSIASIPAMAQSFAERAIEKYRVKTLRELWPNLSCLIYGGVALTQANKNNFLTLFGESTQFPFHFWELYAATEGQFGHQLYPDWNGMIFNPFDNFYQFLENGSGPPRQLHELENGKQYVMLITTPGGLINYNLGDWIEILSTKPLTFHVIGRGQEEISVATEKISRKQIDIVIEKLSLKFKQTINEYAVWLETRDKHQLIFAIPHSHPHPIPNLSIELDLILDEINPFYKDLKTSYEVYRQCKVHYLPIDFFKKYQNRNVHRGQFKPKRVFRSKEAFEQEYLQNQTLKDFGL